MKTAISHKESLAVLRDSVGSFGFAGNAGVTSKVPVGSDAPMGSPVEQVPLGSDHPMFCIECDTCQLPAVEEIPFTTFRHAGEEMAGPWYACERCSALIAQRATKRLIAIMLDNPDFPPELQGRFAVSWKPRLKKLYASRTGASLPIGGLPTSNPFGLPPATLRRSNLSPWDRASKQFDFAKARPGFTVTPSFIIDNSPSAETESPLFRATSCVLRNKALELVAFLTYFPEGSPRGKRFGEYELYVNPTFRRAGNGLRMLAYADRRFQLDFTIQSYTVPGRLLALSYLESRDNFTKAIA
jgi:hypothetical protein